MINIKLKLNIKVKILHQRLTRSSTEKSKLNYISLLLCVTCIPACFNSKMSRDVLFGNVILNHKYNAFTTEKVNYSKG